MYKQCPRMADLAEYIMTNPQEFRDYVECSQPFTQKLPGGFSEKLTNFQTLVLVKCFHEHKVLDGLTHFVRNDLGETFTRSPPAAISGVYDDTSKCESQLHIY